MIRRRIYVAVAIMMLAITVKADWIPDHKYAHFLPAFKVDNVWQFAAEANDKEEDPLLGCTFLQKGGVISWAMMSWNNRYSTVSTDDDHNMKWAEIYLVNGNDTLDQIKLCKIITEGYVNGIEYQQGWKCYSIENINGTTCLAKETFRKTNHDSGFLYMETFYTEEIRQFLEHVGANLQVRFITLYDVDKSVFKELNYRSAIEQQDRILQSRPTAPDPDNVAWTVNNINQTTCISFHHGLDTTKKHQLYIVEDTATTNVTIAPTVYYHPIDLGNRAGSLKYTDALHLKTYCTETYIFSKNYYASDKPELNVGNRNAELNSVQVSLTSPAFAQPHSASVTENGNGTNTVMWYCDTLTGSGPCDLSEFVVERATDANFTQNYEIYNNRRAVPYHSNSDKYELTDEHSVRSQGNQTFYYRISRASAVSTELNTCTTQVCNTDYATLGNFEASIDSVAHRVNLKWAYNSGIRDGQLVLHIGYSNTNLEIPSTDTMCQRNGIHILECVETTFVPELYANGSRISNYLPSTVTMPHETPGVIDTMMASAGFYNDHVNVKWRINQVYPFFNYFVITRTEYNSAYPIEETLATVAMDAGVYDYTYVDNTCIPGVYYEYKITGRAQCEDTIMSISEKKAIGFAQPYGAVSGQITFDGSQAVPGVKVVAECESQYGGKSLWLKAENKPNIEMPVSIVNQIVTSPTGTIEFFVKISDTRRRFPLMHFGNMMSLESMDTTLYLKAGSDSAAVLGAIVPGAFTHLAMTFSTEGNQRTVLLYKNGEQIASITVTLANQTGVYDDELRFGSDGNGRYMSGNLDEIRIWNTQRTPEEVELYRSVYLNGTEDGLVAYYRCDDKVGRMLFDLSKTGSTFNCRHIPMENVVIDENNIPTPDQLGHTAYTDANGTYLFNNIPFSAQGSIYNIVPMLGIHEFSPSLTPLYFNSNANSYNRINFTDVSSFPVSGKVTYYNTNYPVEGCTFLVDGTTLCIGEDGETVESDENGEYTIYVPIGKHSITAVKGTHVFANNGRYPENANTKYDFQNEITNLTFQDSTFMLVTGRVSGGEDEAEKAHGFGLGNAVMGRAEIVLGTPGDLYNLNLDEERGRVFTMPQDSIYGTCNSRAYTEPAYQNNAHYITIQTDSITGEFNVMLPPLDYEVRSIELKNNKDYISFDLSSIGNINLSKKETIQVKTDSAIVDYDQYSYFSYSEALDAIYYAQPQMTVRENTQNLALGATGYVFIDAVTGVTDTVPLYQIDENGSITYLLGYPCYTTGEQNTWLISAYEQYVNYDRQKPDTTLQPFRYGVVTVSNSFGTQMKNDVALTDTTVFYSTALAVTVSGDELMLDENGTTYYSFQVGEPNILAPYTSYFSVYYEDPARTRHYDWDGNENNEVIVLGSKVIGTNFETKGPDEIFYILRDPVGSESYAEWEKGETITREKVSTWSFARSVHYSPGKSFKGDSYKIDLEKPMNEIVLGTTVQLESKEGGRSIRGIINYDGVTYWSSTNNWEFTNSQTVATSSDPMMVGSKADVYIGAGTNLLYGDAEQVYVKRDTAGNYSIDVQPVLSVEKEFTTQFNYSQMYIEENLIPDIKKLRNQLLTQVTVSQYDTSFVNNTNAPVYITTLASTDTDYGKDSTYLMIIPESWKNDSTRIAVDEVGNYNVQIQSWVEAMAHNEHCKAIVHNSSTPFNRTLWEQAVYGSSVFPFASVYAPSVDSTYTLFDDLVAQYEQKKAGWLDQNYSLAGTSLSVNETREYSSMSNGWSNTQGLDFGAGFTVYMKKAFTSVSHTVSGGAEINNVSENGTTIEQSSSVTYNIELGLYDAMTIDVYQSPDGFGPIFAVRGGQTSCPHQEAEYTKYYEPGTEIQAATIPVAEPRITVQNPIVNNVPVGESAFFNFQVANVSTVTNALTSFVIAQEVSSNPDGALILINGHELTQEGTGFNMYGGDVINKTIEVAQTRYDILDYDSIAVVFYTDCYMYDADTVYISAHFVQTCADIELSADYNILNNTTEETVEFTIEGFNQQFRNLNGVELQYKRMGDTDWHLLEAFPADSAAVITYEFSFTKPSFPDGTYLFRAVTKCQYGNSWVTNESLPVTVVVDMAEPEPLGEPYPLDGFYVANSQIYVEFNEPIQTGRVLSDNVQVEGVLNAHDVDHSISMLLDHSTAMTNATYTLGTTPFTLEMWINYSQPGTLFSYANGANSGIEFGIDSNNHLTATVNGTSYTSTGVMTPDTWGYLIIQCDAVNGQLSATYSYENQNVTIFNATGIGQAAASGNIRFGGNNLVAMINEVSLWKELRTTADALAERTESKNPYTQGLLSLWHLEEGEGFTATDAVRQRNLTLSADNWAYNHDNYAMKVSAGDTALVDVSNAPLNTGKNFVMEFWFRANGDAVLCSFPEQGFVMSIVNGSLVAGGYTIPISNYLNDVWHHFALIKSKNAMPVMAIDGKQLASARVTALPPFTVSKVSFGSPVNTNDIQIDEFRLWNIKSTLDAVNLLRGTCLDGDEEGLVAYYPMEEYVTDPISSQTTTQFSLYDRTDDQHTRAISHTDLADAQAASSPKLVESRPTEYVAHTFTTSNNKIMVNITEDDARIEGCELEITVKDIVDMNGNYSDPVRWTVFVNRNQLLWDNDSYEVEKDQEADTTIQLTIVNNSSMIQNWEISGAPSCMTLSQTSGIINPLQRVTIDCTIDATADLGENEYELALSGDEGMESYLYITTEVYANEPEWEINPNMFENSMNIVAYAEIDGWVADDEQDMVAAFVDGELAGVTNLELLPAMGRYYIMMTIYQNETTTLSPREVTFKYWDASTGKIYNNSQAYQTVNDTTYNPITITYSDNLTLGSIVRPIRIVMGEQIEQTIQLNRGWNWISYNVVPTSASFSDILRKYLSGFAIIKSQTGFGVSDSVSASVRGSIGAMDCSKGYRMKAIVPFEMTLSGYAAPLTPINFAPQQWTWFGFQPQRALTVNAAMSNINPTVGDIVKSQTQFATWDGYQWVGSLNVMMPGKSYIYNNTGNTNITFSYPDYSAEASYQIPMQNTAVASYFDPVDPGKYQGNMSITAVVKYEGEAVSEAEIGIFAGSECRASATYNDGYYFVTVPGDSAVMLTVKVLYNDSVYVLSEGIEYRNDAVVGTLDEPYLIELSPEATSVVTVAADKEGDKVEKIMIDNEVFIIRNGKVYDVLGRPRREIR